MACSLDGAGVGPGGRKVVVVVVVVVVDIVVDSEGLRRQDFRADVCSCCNAR